MKVREILLTGTNGLWAARVAGIYFPAVIFNREVRVKVTKQEATDFIHGQFGKEYDTETDLMFVTEKNSDGHDILILAVDDRPDEVRNPPVAETTEEAPAADADAPKAKKGKKAKAETPADETADA